MSWKVRKALTAVRAALEAAENGEPTPRGYFGCTLDPPPSPPPEPSVDQSGGGRRSEDGTTVGLSVTVSGPNATPTASSLPKLDSHRHRNGSFECSGEEEDEEGLFDDDDLSTLRSISCTTSPSHLQQLTQVKRIGLHTSTQSSHPIKAPKLITRKGKVSRTPLVPSLLPRELDATDVEEMMSEAATRSGFEVLDHCDDSVAEHYYRMRRGEASRAELERQVLEANAVTAQGYEQERLEHARVHEERMKERRREERKAMEEANRREQEFQQKIEKAAMISRAKGEAQQERDRMLAQLTQNVQVQVKKDAVAQAEEVQRLKMLSAEQLKMQELLTRYYV